MYLISAYFDENTNKILNRYINGVAQVTGNDFMIRNNVPPHLTITSVEAMSGNDLESAFRQACRNFKAGDIVIPSIGQLLPYVIYTGAVLNEYLYELQQEFVAAMEAVENTSISKYYMPHSWMPHVTIGKTLSGEQMLQAFEYMQKSFAPVSGKIVEIGLAKTNPHEDLVRIKLPVS